MIRNVVQLALVEAETRPVELGTGPMSPLCIAKIEIVIFEVEMRPVELETGPDWMSPLCIAKIEIVIFRSRLNFETFFQKRLFYFFCKIGRL